MPLLHESSDAKKFDTRMVERNISRGIVSAADADKSLKGLPDDAVNADYVNLDVIGVGEGSRKAPANGTPESDSIVASLSSPS